MSGGALYLWVPARFESWKTALFMAVALVSLSLKLNLAAHGHNFDVDSYGIVASLVLHGKSVYANTSRFNYAPVWSLVVAGLSQISDVLPIRGGETFHVTVAVFLGLTDIALAALLSTQFRYGAGIFFLCCPAIMLLTGRHSQFENLALLAGIASWLLIRGGSATTPRLLLAAGVQGLSLIIKHVLFLFPLWIFFWKELGSWQKRATFVVVSYGMFALSFLPWLPDPASREGIVRNVLLYRSQFMYSISQLLASVSFLAVIPKQGPTVLTLGWIAIVVLAGYLVARRKCDIFPMYLLIMFSFSPALRDQYLALPLLACAILYTSWPCWAFTVVATLALLSSPYNVACLPLQCYYTVLVSTQICAAVFFWVELRGASAWRRPSSPAPVLVRDAVALTLGSVAMVTAILLLKTFAVL